MNHKPVKITVATVTYNAVGVLQRTLDSVAAQNYAHVEHLIVDGNSQDGTMELVHHYQGRNSNAARILVEFKFLNFILWDTVAHLFQIGQVGQQIENAILIVGDRLYFTDKFGHLRLFYPFWFQLAGSLRHSWSTAISDSSI